MYGQAQVASPYGQASEHIPAAPSLREIANKSSQQINENLVILHDIMVAVGCPLPPSKGHAPGTAPSSSLTNTSIDIQNMASDMRNELESLANHVGATTSNKPN